MCVFINRVITNIKQQMAIQNLLEWQNLVFALPMVLALILLGLSMSGSLGEHDTSVDHDVSVDHDATVHSGDNMPHDFSHDLDHDMSPSLISVMLSALGIGRVPLSILGFCWLMIFGFVGLVLNSLWQGVFGSVNILVLVSAIVAFVSSLTVTSFLARVIARFMPQTESHMEKFSDFVNREAEVRFTVTATSGTITLNDKYGNLQTLMAKRDVSCESDIAPDTKVVILSYFPQEKVFIVIPAQNKQS